MELTPLMVLRFAAFAVSFFVGCISIVVTQVFANVVFAWDPQSRHALMGATKTHFLILFVFLSHLVSPNTISITYNPNNIPAGNSFRVDLSQNLFLILNPNTVWISNHQIYTDWLYMWFVAYSGRLSDYVYIMLKDMSNIPILGYGMKNYGFFFLSRKWDTDKVVLTNQLLALDANARGVGPANGVRHVSSANVADASVHHWPLGSSGDIWPYHVILFPEGTVTSIRTRARSDQFCDSRGLPRLKHTLLPRVRGLFLTLRKLRGSLEAVFDVTAGYAGLRPDQIGEDIFSLKAFYIQGRGPKAVHYHVQAYALKDIPLGKETEDIDDVSDADFEAFESWLFKFWYEKDARMARFYDKGSFVDLDGVAAGDVTVEAKVKLRFFPDIGKPFLSLATLALILRLVWMGVVHLLSLERNWGL